MPLGPFGEIYGTTNTLEGVSERALENYETKVIAPRNPKLLREPEPPFKMKPSQYMFQMSLDTEKKLANTHNMNLPKKIQLLDMGETTYQKGKDPEGWKKGQTEPQFTQVDIEEAIFQPYPSEIFFMNYEPHEIAEITLLLRNNDKVPRLIKVTQADSPYFRIVSPPNLGNKVAPGLAVTFTIQFIPDEKRDYTHELVCITEREKFVVPVRCIGSRGILDFPDEVNFGTCPVKFPTQRTLFVRNVGNKEAKFVLESEKPFKVTPSNGVVPVGEAIQVVVEYCPGSTGEHEGDLKIHYDTGEDIFMRVYGVSENVGVRLDKQSVRVENTYVGLASQRTVVLHNRSDVMAHFRWTRFSTALEEDMEREMMMQMLNSQKEEETQRFQEKVHEDPTIRDKVSIVSRKFLNKKRMLENNTLLFEDDIVSLDPYEGDIWPHSTRDVIITFKPTEAREYQRVAFCDVTGRETRLPLKITGLGIGPKLQFSFTNLDMGFLFVNSEHAYELVLANKGDIDAMYKLQGSGSAFSRCFTFTPDDGLISPGGHQAIHIAFKSLVLGDFSEQFSFHLDGSLETVDITIKGTVVGPTFNFDIPKLKFGSVSYGFPVAQSVTLLNTSLVAMQFALRVPSDGTGRAVRATDDLVEGASEEYVDSHQNHQGVAPKEFDIEPSSGTIQPLSSARIQVTLNANRVGKYSTTLVVDVIGVGKDILNLPISANSVIPYIKLAEPIIEMNRCFLDYPYECVLKLVNDTTLPAKYQLLPQIRSALTSVFYHTEQPKGVIMPGTTLDVSVILRVMEREENEVLVHIKIFGSTGPTLDATIHCFGEGPVVNILPSHVDWGQIPVLQDVPMTMQLCNEALIPASFTAFLQRPDTVFRVLPNSGIIPAQESMKIQVVAHLNDCLQFQDVIQFDIKDSPSKMIQLVAVGQGSTIIIEPSMPSLMDLGPHFSRTPLKKVFKLTNCGRRHQQLVWSIDGYSYSKASRQSTAADGKTKNFISAPTFLVSPHRFDLSPGEVATVTVHADVDSPRFAKERILCHAIIGRQGGKELIKKVDVQADFIAPLVEFSSNSINFRVEKNPTDILDIISKELSMKNLNGLDLNLLLKVKYPFQLRISPDDVDPVQDYKLTLNPGQEITLQVLFDPTYKGDFYSRSIEDKLLVAYEEHPHVDQILLKGEVYFPNVRFETHDINFGCILNHTEATKYVSMMNDSPLLVRYRWNFLVGDKPNIIFHRRGVQQLLNTAGTGVTDEENDKAESEEEQWENEKSEKGKDAGSDKENVQEILDEFGLKERVPSLQLRMEENETGELPTLPSFEQPQKHLLHVSNDTGTAQRARGFTPGQETSRSVPHANTVLQSLLQEDEQVIPLGIEEIFDVTPLYGEIASGQTETLTMTFFGHADIEAQVTAVCEIEGGPMYLLNIHGEASLVEYSFDSLEVDFGTVQFDHVATGEIMLRNKGKVGFMFQAKNVAATQQGVKPLPQQPTLHPVSGYVAPFSEHSIQIKYLPGVPDIFCCQFPIQVAHFEDVMVTLRGVGSFPRVILDLPRFDAPGTEYATVATAVLQDLALASQRSAYFMPMSPVSFDLSLMDTSRGLLKPSSATMQQAQPPQEHLSLNVQLEVERRIVCQSALKKQEARRASESINRLVISREDEEAPAIEIAQRLSQARLSTVAPSEHSSVVAKKAKPQQPKAKVTLPEYILDFGHVILGEIRSHIVRVTNVGEFSVSFKTDRSAVANAGFIVELDRVRNLPGAPNHETLNFVIRFDPRGANLPLGPVDKLLKLSITNGPLIPIRLKAHVTMGDLEVNQEVVDFKEVKCGEAKVITVQLHNPSLVVCQWSSLAAATAWEAREAWGDDGAWQATISQTGNLGASGGFHQDCTKDFWDLERHRQQQMMGESKKRVKKGNKKNVQETPPVFEMLPSTGYIRPNERINVQIKFMPMEEKQYEHRLCLRVSKSSNRLMIRCRGHGMEPRLDFDQTLVNFGPILPFSAGDDKNIVVKNPCPFPIEFYNLEFDPQYLQEEQILRLVTGYDNHDILILPPRNVGERLPEELLEHYDEQLKKLAESEKQQMQEGTEEAAAASQEIRATSPGATGEDVMTHRSPKPGTEPGDGSTVAKQDEVTEKKVQLPGAPESELGFMDTDNTPAKRAIARYLKLDLSKEGKAAIYRRGIGIVIHGAPLTGKTTLAVDLARRYEAALLTLNGCIIEAMTNCNTQAGIRARELCQEAARRKAEQEQAEMEEHMAQAALLAEQQQAAAAAAAAAPSGRKGASVASQQQGQQAAGEAGRKPGAGQQAVGGKGGKGAHGAVQQPDNVSQVPSSPPPLSAPIAQPLSLTDGLHEESLLSVVLPDDLVVEILSERLMLNDCHRGVVFDGLDTLFCQDMHSAALNLLKAFNNRRHIYFVTLQMNFASYKERLRQSELAKEHEIAAAEERERERMEEMTEEDYDALPEEERNRIDEMRLAFKRERIRKKMEEDAEREREEAERRDAELRRLEEEKNAKRKGRRAAGAAADDKNKAAAPKAPAQPAPVAKDGRLTREGTVAKTQTSMAVSTREERPDSHATEKSDGKHDLASDEKRRKSKAATSGTQLIREPTEVIEEVKDPKKEAELLLHQKFKTFETENQRIQEILKNWDRSHICERRPATPSDHSEVGAGGIAAQEEANVAAAGAGTAAAAQGAAKKGAAQEKGAAGKGGQAAGKKVAGGKDAHEKDGKVRDKGGMSAMDHMETVIVHKLPLLPEGITTSMIPAPASGTAPSSAGGSTAVLEELATASSSLISVPNLILDCNVRNLPQPPPPLPEGSLPPQPAGAIPGVPPVDERPMIMPPFNQEVKSIPDLATEVSHIVNTQNPYRFLPSVEEVLDGLGLGNRGPIIPPEVTFSVVKYPPSRKSPAELLGTNVAAHYRFLASPSDELNAAGEQKIPELDEESEKAKEEPATPAPVATKGKGRKNAGGESGKEKEKPEKGEKPRRSASRQKASRRDSDSVSPANALMTPFSEDGHKLGNFRWVIPANGEVTLRLRFCSEELGQFDQTLNFEVVGTKRRYQLYCRGVCSFPTISREPRIVFPSRKKTKKSDEIVSKKFILATETFEFGPLHCEKVYDRVRAGQYPENVEHLTVHNTSPMPTDISFSFLSDAKPEAYSMEPVSMHLNPGESQRLTLWAHPRQPGRFEDAIVCCVQENPEPIIFRIACDGQRPELELDKRILQFERVLLHRKDTKTLFLRNSTLLPVAWKISGLEALGDDFSMEQDVGVIEPRSELPLHIHFRAMKPYKANQKRSIRLEVRDVDNIVGVLQTETIQIVAEAYDVALDMSFPKGADGGLDFGILHVGEETKQILTLKNKGPYEIHFNFEIVAPPGVNCKTSDLFSLQPQRGVLMSGDKSVQVQITYKANTEVAIREQPVLKCQVIEPTLGDKGEMIASIPIKVSVRSVYSKFVITPSADINFGAVIIQNKKTRQFTIENVGEFEFKFAISRVSKEKEVKEVAASKLKPKEGGKRAKSRDGSSSGRSAIPPKRVEARADAPLIGGSQGRLQAGLFTVTPASGAIPSKHSLAITVDCFAESPGICDEELMIEVADRNPKMYPQGVSYRLFADASVPSIEINDIANIFEEHRICKNLNQYQMTSEIRSGGIYSEEENRFLFPNVLVGQRSSARFRVSNIQRVPCDAVFTVKSHTTASNEKALRSSAKQALEVFEVSPNRVQIQPHSHAYVTVHFTPTSMQNYSAVFEANVDGLGSSQYRSRPMTFEVIGEGNLPRVSVQKPALKNKRGQPVCLFRKLLCGRQETLPLVIANDGNLACQVVIDLVDPDKAYSISPDLDSDAEVLYCDSNNDGIRHPHNVAFNLAVAQKAQFFVKFEPKQCVRSAGTLKVSVVNNQYEDTLVQLVGEGYEDEVTLSDLTQPVHEAHPLATTPELSMEEVDDNITAAKNNFLNFGCSPLNENLAQAFTLNNHSASATYRFQWPADVPQLKFSPAIGHLAPGQSKRIVATFKASQATTWKEKPILCKLSKITYTDPNTPGDWDSSKTTMKWIDIEDGKRDADRPKKKRIIETETEPTFTEMADSIRNLELLISIVTNFTKYGCATQKINFKDTLMFQTRQFTFPLVNEGDVHLEYQWQVVMESPDPNRCATPRDARPTSARLNEDAFCNVPCPFTVEPMQGCILPGGRTQITVFYSPLAVAEFEARLLCHINNLDSSSDKHAGPTISVRGRSMQPFCHFELENSDYLTGSRRNPELKGPGDTPAGASLDPQTRVIEMVAVGVERTYSKIFTVVNPTRISYDFKWLNDDSVDVKQPDAFRCLIKEGHIKAGRKFEMAFSFTSHQLGVAESFWKFVIPEHNIVVPFLLVGDVREPQMTFDRSHFNYRALLVGHEAHETVNLVNLESEAFEYVVEASSLYGPGMCNILRVDPMDGVVQPKSRVPIRISFTPKDEREINFNMLCHVPHRTQPLTLNVKAEGYAMRSSLWYLDAQEHSVEVSPEKKSSRDANDMSSMKVSKNETLSTGCLVDFETVEIGENINRVFKLHNDGKFDFHYTWSWEFPASQVGASAEAAMREVLQMEPMSGMLPHNEMTEFMLFFKPTARIVLRHCYLRLEISNGHSYLVQVSGSAVAPGLVFSFQKWNFGPSFLYRAGAEPASKELTIQNTEKKAVSVDCLYESSLHLGHNFKPTVLEPGQTLSSTFTFMPREARAYREVVEFEINGISRQKVEFFGKGTEVQVEVTRTKDKIVRLGTLKVGESVSKTVSLVNHSLAPLSFRLSLSPSHAELKEEGALKLKPDPETTTFTLAEKGSATLDVEVVFSPVCRIGSFTEEVFLEANGMSVPVFAISGACHGYDIHFDMEAVAFGVVTKGSELTKRLVMINSGDIGAKFKWRKAAFQPDFSIKPTDGYITPGMDVPFEITFKPSKVASDIRYEKLLCDIEGWRPLMLTLTGICTEVVPVRETYNFNAYVRQPEVRSLPIRNYTNATLWTLKPVIQGEQWSGPETLVVEPQQTRNYDLTYLPFTMTGEKKHQGCVFFALPDGSALQYNLQGTADPPKVVNRISRDVPCKTHYTELLPVTNWLKRPQRFKVTRETMKGDQRQDSSTQIKGLDYLDVPGSSTKEYKLSYYAHREGQQTFKVTFTNESTGEFLFYELQFRAGRPSQVGVIELKTPVRQAISHTVQLENPLQIAVTFTAMSTLSDLHYPAQLQIPAQSEGSVTVDFLPLKVGEQQGRLEFTCPELGLYVYDVHAQGCPAGPERAIYFRTNLGLAQTQTARFFNHVKARTDYSCRVELVGNSALTPPQPVAPAPAPPAPTAATPANATARGTAATAAAAAAAAAVAANAPASSAPSTKEPQYNGFHVDKVVTAAPGAEVSLDVVFEPVQLGDVRANLIISSNVGGDFVFPLWATALPPKPQGPFTVKAGSNTNIPFRNIFTQPTTFTFYVDNPVFHLAKTSENIRARKDHRIVVGYDGAEGGPVMGKLIVTSPFSAANGQGNLQWVFYLKGTSPT